MCVCGCMRVCVCVGAVWNKLAVVFPSLLSQDVTGVCGGYNEKKEELTLRDKCVTPLESSM